MRREGGEVGPVGCEVFERRAALAEIPEVRDGERGLAERLRAVDCGETDEPVRFSVGQGTEDDGLKNREDRDVDADTEREHREGEDGEPGRTAERAEGGGEFVGESLHAPTIAEAARRSHRTEVTVVVMPRHDPRSWCPLNSCVTTQRGLSRIT